MPITSSRTLVRLELSGFKSFAKKTSFEFTAPLVAVVGPNGSGKSNVAEAIRFVLGEQSMKSMRGKRGEDMIWNGSSAVPRMGKASVAITFDNTSRFLSLDFDEVTIERTVHRDGVNEYRMNGSTVRLKDILEVMAGANIGASGHHIISQGEADKILSASARERREMLEDALGLKVFHYRREEATRKLTKTEENMRQIEALKREVAPHLRFLKRQVDKLEKAETLKREGIARCKAYFARESAYLAEARAHLASLRREAASSLARASEAMRAAKATLAQHEDTSEATRIVTLSEELESARRNRSEALRESARLAGSIEALEKSAAHASISKSELAAVIEEGERVSGGIETLAELRTFVGDFIRKLKELLSAHGGGALSVADMHEEKRRADEKEAAYAKDEARLARELDAIRSSLEAARKEERAAERELFELSSKERDARHALSLIESDEERLSLAEAEYKRNLAEAAALFGRDAVVYDTAPAGDRAEQEREKRELEKIKIRLEEMGAGGGEEVLREYHEAVERDAFLEKELGDLAASAESLRALIADLEKELSVRFSAGLAHINTEFTRLFAKMFDGGSAALTVSQEPVRRPRSLIDENDDGVPDDMEETDVGVDITLSIPRKRIRSLTMLSGGERALTSIALIFAMSSVNPPPFLVLDETDAALDEANSRRYGDMVEALAEKSQLLLITHNRETMSRAGVLYGVTMGADGVSKVLSVQLEEAVRVAK